MHIMLTVTTPLAHSFTSTALNVQEVGAKGKGRK